MKKKNNWRITLGMIVFFLGFGISLFVPVIALLNIPGNIKAVLMTIMIAAPEVLTIVSVALMGKEGFNFCKQKIFKFLKKHGPPDEVSPLRYKIGLVMFSLSLLIGWASPYVGHHIPFYEKHEIIFAISGDLILFSSLFILGGNFWDKIRSLFVREAKPLFPKKDCCSTNW